MSNRVADPRTERIVVRGEFGPILATIPGSECAVVSGNTHIKVLVHDQAELFRVLDRLRDLGASIVSLSIED